MEIVNVLGVVAALWLMIAAAGAFPLVLLWFADFNDVENPRPIVSRAIKAIGKEWLIEAQFKPEGAVSPLGVQMALFRHRSNHTAFAVYFIAGKTVTDFVTAFPNVGVTTTSTIDGIAAPLPPGSVMQCLPSLELEERWQKHKEAVRLLQEELNTAGQPMDLLSEELAHSQRRQIRHIFTSSHIHGSS